MTNNVWVGDLEANGLLPTVTQVWCGVFENVFSGERITFRPHQIVDMLVFMASTDVLIMHNGAGYDMLALEKCYEFTYGGKLVDTLVMSRLLSPNRPRHSVESYGEEFGVYKQEHEDWSQFTEEMLERCHKDVDIQLRIWEELKKKAKGHVWKNAFSVSFQLFSILQRSYDYGWLFDKEHAEKSCHLLTHWIDRIDRSIEKHLPTVLVIEEKDLDSYVKQPFVTSGDYHANTKKWMEKVGLPHGIVGGPYSRIYFRKTNLDSNEELKDLLLEHGWKPAKWNVSATGERTSPMLNHTDPFEGIEGALGRLVAKRVQCRHRRSNIVGWMAEADLREDGRIGQQIAGIADTYRLKHRKIVNVPGEEAFFGKMMRACFIAKPGYKIVGTDSAGCQNRMLAARVNDEKFTEILINGDKEKGTSIHQVNQQAIKAIADVDVSYRVSKNCNYAFMFGASDKKLASTANVALEKGEKIREALLSISPGFKALVDRLTLEWRSNASRRLNKWRRMEYYDGWVIGLDGRPVRIAQEHTILVYVLQSDEAIMMQYALVLLYNWLIDLGWKHGREWGFVCNMHDEIQAEVREDCVEVYAELAEQAIVEAGRALNISCPHQGESKVGNNWKETH